MTRPGGVGIWAVSLRYGDAGAIPVAAAELERLGYTAAWIPDGGGPLFDALDVLLDATSSLVAASGVLNVWAHPPEETLAWWDGLADDRRGRVLLGLGVSHGPRVGDRWGRPMAVMSEYLDALDAGGFPVEHRCLAALGPKMLALAAERSAGAHTYLVTPEHTVTARAALGDGALFVEQGVVLETDPGTARAAARAALAHYAELPNYANNWRRLGFGDDDISGLSDRLIDALVAWGDAEAVVARIEAHRAAGADHVCVQVLTDGTDLPRAAWQELAAALG